jgi:hypothetical protein
MLRAHMRLASGFLLLSIAASTVAACASDEDSIYELDDGRPDASIDGAIVPGSDEDSGFATCDPDFCPVTGPGAPCCVTDDGPCGMDNGLGCQETRRDAGRQ